MSAPTPNTKAKIRGWLGTHAQQPVRRPSTDWITCTECTEEAGDIVLCPKHLNERNAG